MFMIDILECLTYSMSVCYALHESANIFLASLQLRLDHDDSDDQMR
jgi:hypothetical protein